MPVVFLAPGDLGAGAAPPLTDSPPGTVAVGGSAPAAAEPAGGTEPGLPSPVSNPTASEAMPQAALTGPGPASDPFDKDLTFGGAFVG